MVEQTEYKEIRRALYEKNYELIYRLLLKEMVYIRKKNVSVADKEALKNYVDNEARKLVFDDKGIPSFLIKVILLLGEDFENEIRNKLASYITTVYSSRFQLYLETYFTGLSSIQKLYGQLESIVKDYQNKYFNLPQDWNILSEIMKNNYFSMKQRVCDVFYFENIPKDEYVNAFDVVLTEDLKFYKYLEAETSRHQIIECQKESKIDFYGLNLNTVFTLFLPYAELYFDKSFKGFMNSYFDLAETKMKIFSVILKTLNTFEKLYKKLEDYHRRDSLLKLIKYFMSLLCKQFEDCNLAMSRIYDSYEEEPKDKSFYKTRFEIIMIVLNTTAYVYEYIISLQEGLTFTRNEFKLSRDLIYTLSGLEKNFCQKLSMFFAELFAHIEFDKPGFSQELNIHVNAYFLPTTIEELFPDARRILLESLVVFILSKLYLLDFTIEKAEKYLCEIENIKTCLLTIVPSIPLFPLLERYLKIFLCPSDNPVQFVDNFEIFSGGIFTFNQIIDSLSSCQNHKEISKEYLSRIKTKDNISDNCMEAYNYLDQLNEMEL